MRRLLVLTIAALQIALGGVAAAETLPCRIELLPSRIRDHMPDRYCRTLE